MKRGKPLNRTPLKRGESELKRSPLAKRSKKTEELYVKRRALVKELLEAHNYCEACSIFHVLDILSSSPPHLSPPSFGIVRPNKTRDIHELINRSQGGSILERKNVVAVCRPCHTRITTNPKEAERVGLHLESWCNTDAHFSEAERLRNEWSKGNPAQPYWFSN